MSYHASKYSHVKDAPGYRVFMSLPQRRERQGFGSSDIITRKLALPSWVTCGMVINEWKSTYLSKMFLSNQIYLIAQFTNMLRNMLEEKKFRGQRGRHLECILPILRRQLTSFGYKICIWKSLGEIFYFCTAVCRLAHAFSLLLLFFFHFRQYFPVWDYACFTYCLNSRI